MSGSARGAVGTVAVLLVAALSAGTGVAQLPSQVPSLPSLTAEMLLGMAKVDLPTEDGVSLEIHADFPEEAPLLLDGLEIYSLTATITPEGQLVLGSTKTAQTAASGDGGTPECSDDAFVPTGQNWAAENMPVRWAMNRRSIPRSLSKDLTHLEIRRAHRIWTHVFSRCIDTDPVSFDYAYAGTTFRHPDFDDVNAVDFGSLGGGILALNYVWHSGTNILEVDLRLNKKDYRWTNVPGVKRYQVKNVVTHELGHQFGLDDLGDPHGALTMFGRIAKGERKKISLGRGDVRGAELLSP